MKKNAFLFPVIALSFVVGLIACSNNSKYVPQTNPLAYTYIMNTSGWTIQSIVVVNTTTNVTNTYTSADSLSSSRLLFGYGTNIYGSTYTAYAFADKNNPSYVGPKNDSTLFRYASGAWSFDATWAANANAGNTNAMPDSLLFQAGVFTNDRLAGVKGPVFRCKINQFDSLHFRFSYLDTTIVNTANNQKYNILKTVTLTPATN